MSRGYINRKKAIRDLRKAYVSETNDTLKFYAVEYNDRWSGVAARLALIDRGVSI